MGQNANIPYSWQAFLQANQLFFRNNRHFQAILQIKSNFTTNISLRKGLESFAQYDVNKYQHTTATSFEGSFDSSHNTRSFRLTFRFQRAAVLKICSFRTQPERFFGGYVLKHRWRLAKFGTILDRCDSSEYSVRHACVLLTKLSVFFVGAVCALGFYRHL